VAPKDHACWPCRRGSSSILTLRRIITAAKGLMASMEDEDYQPTTVHRKTRFRENWSISLNISQVFKLVKCSPVASCLGSSWPGRNPSRLTPIPQPRDRHSVRISHGA
jgi:hypothetical protein